MSTVILSEISISNGTILLTFLISLIKLSSEINLTLFVSLSVKFHCFGDLLSETKSLYPKKKPVRVSTSAIVKESLKWVLWLFFLPLNNLKIKIKIPPHIIIKQRN